VLRIRKVSYLRVEVLAAVLLKIQVIWDVRPCRLVKRRLRFERRNALGSSSPAGVSWFLIQEYEDGTSLKTWKTCCLMCRSLDMKDREEGYWTSGFRRWDTQSHLQCTDTKKTKA